MKTIKIQILAVLAMVVAFSSCKKDFLDLKPYDALPLDDALNNLAAIDPRRSQVVELRYFGGLSVEETSEVLNVSSGTVMRDWSAARAWLYRALSNEKANRS